jgi:hypothetical protein
MFEIRTRPRALPLQVINGTDFPGIIYFDPLEAPIFKLTISNHLKFGVIHVYYGDEESDIVLQESPLTIDLQNSHSYSEQTTLFPKGFLIGIDNEEDDNLGHVFMTTYTYYWEV